MQINLLSELLLFGLLWSLNQVFLMITLNVSGAIKKYNAFAYKKRLKDFCEWCFSFHCSWISAVFYLALTNQEIYGSSLLAFVIIVPMMTVITFLTYRILGLI